MTIDWINFLSDIRLLFELINSKTKINFINQVYITQWKIFFVNVILLLSRFLNNENRYCYDIYKFIYNFIDSWEQRRQYITLFYTINYSKFNVIFEMFILIDQIILVNSQTINWRFQIKIIKLFLKTFKQFARNLKFYKKIYAFIYVVVNTQKNEKSKKSNKMSNELTNYANQYNDEKIEILFEQNRDDYVIDLIENQKSFFMFLYNLSQIELTKFRRYLDDILLKNWIKHFIFFAKIFIFFIFKKNNNFRLCVDYRNLNAIIIKNRHSLFLIIEILNRLCDVVLFIKLNFIHIYYRIRIKKKMNKKQFFARDTNISNIKLYFLN